MGGGELDAERRRRVTVRQNAISESQCSAWWEGMTLLGDWVPQAAEVGGCGSVC